MYTLDTLVEDSIVYQSTLLPKAFIKPCLVQLSSLSSSTCCWPRHVRLEDRLSLYHSQELQESKSPEGPERSPAVVAVQVVLQLRLKLGKPGG